MLRRIAGGVVGAFAAMAVVILVEVVGHVFWPPPPGFDANDESQWVQLMASMPVAAKLCVVVAWALGALAGGLVATLIARHRMPALVIGAVLLVTTVTNLASIPHPWWMWLAGILIPLPCATLGAMLAARRLSSVNSTPAS